MSPERANAIYDVLVLHCSADFRYRDDFVHYHTHPSVVRALSVGDHVEWHMLGGNLGWGGKYRANQNRVTCYPEDSTPMRDEIIERVNKILEVV